MKHPTPENQPLDSGFSVEVKGDKLMLSLPTVHELTVEETNVLQEQLSQGKLRAILNRLEVR